MLVPAVRKRVLSVSNGEEIKNGSIHFAAKLFDTMPTHAPKSAGLKLTLRLLMSYIYIWSS